MAKEADEQDIPKKVTDIDALSENTTAAVIAFSERWIPMPGFGENVEVMDLGQLRDAMGLRVTFEAGDPWPTAEKLLLGMGFRWHWLGSQRVMYLKEKEDYQPDTGWEEAEEQND